MFYYLKLNKYMSLGPKHLKKNKKNKQNQIEEQSQANDKPVRASLLFILKLL